MLALDADAPKPPAYPFIKQQFQRAILRQNFTRPRFPSVSPLALSSDFPGLTLAFAAVRSRHRHVSASVSGYLRRHARTRKREKRNPGKKLCAYRKRREIWGLAQDLIQDGRYVCNFLAQLAAQSRPCPQTHALARALGAAFGISRTPRTPTARAA